MGITVYKIYFIQFLVFNCNRLLFITQKVTFCLISFLSIEIIYSLIKNKK